MKSKIRSSLYSIVEFLGLNILPHGMEQNTFAPKDLSELSAEIWEIVKPFTMTSPERVNALVESVQYVVKNKIPGVLVECGVWKGGSAMAIALTLMRMKVMDREIYLYDTFQGMSAPGKHDISSGGIMALRKYNDSKTLEGAVNWCYSPLEDVMHNVFATGYPKEKFHFIKGMVEETLPLSALSQIALLRLDTDWYESTKQELFHLFPLLERQGVLIIDDYGCWQGARKAVDEYFEENKIGILLNRIDNTGRVGVKM